MWSGWNGLLLIDKDRDLTPEMYRGERKDRDPERAEGITTSAVPADDLRISTGHIGYRRTLHM